MAEDIARFIFRNLFNFLGACIRWTLGTIYNAIRKNPKTPFKEYLNGPIQNKYDLTNDNDLNRFDEDDGYDSHKNIVVGGIFFLGLTFIIVKQLI
ncbi:hypothetical protein [Aestuariibaculum suncheonense]|uniref:Uncharacterized protein n=1 Tax=Aestuariibaculum suncheonense TaxID=1028745 RepID=A0A8J6QGD6_9FLAO|nr:hypothetical protein [Aestuariibaculum suncheonense]MBD0836105.1 hypothetical protein [Aestuariibaculum suncheonense]